MNLMCPAELCFLMCQYQLLREISYQFYQVHSTAWNILYFSYRRDQLFSDIAFLYVRAVL